MDFSVDIAWIVLARVQMPPGICTRAIFKPAYAGHELVKLDKSRAIISCWREVNNPLHETYLKSLNGSTPA